MDEIIEARVNAAEGGGGYEEEDDDGSAEIGKFDTAVAIK